MRTPCLLSLIMAAVALSSVAAARDERRRDRDDHQRARITFYEHADFRGTFFTLESGRDLQNLTRERFANGARANDRISSIRVEGDAEVFVFRDINFRGDLLRITRDIRNLSESGWNDAISSIRVEPARDRRGPGPR